jgi:hypothetical protein
MGVFMSARAIPFLDVTRAGATEAPMSDNHPGCHADSKPPVGDISPAGTVSSEDRGRKRVIVEGDRSRAAARGSLTSPAQRARLLMVAAALGAIAAAASAQQAHAQTLPSAQHPRPPAISDHIAGG